MWCRSHGEVLLSSRLALCERVRSNTLHQHTRAAKSDAVNNKFQICLNNDNNDKRKQVHHGEQRHQILLEQRNVDAENQEGCACAQDAARREEGQVHGGRRGERRGWQEGDVGQQRQQPLAPAGLCFCLLLLGSCCILTLTITLSFLVFCCWFLFWFSIFC